MKRILFSLFMFVPYTAQAQFDGTVRDNNALRQAGIRMDEQDKKISAPQAVEIIQKTGMSGVTKPIGAGDSAYHCRYGSVRVIEIFGGKARVIDDDFENEHSVLVSELEAEVEEYAGIRAGGKAYSPTRGVVTVLKVFSRGKVRVVDETFQNERYDDAGRLEAEVKNYEWVQAGMDVDQSRYGKVRILRVFSRGTVQIMDHMFHNKHCVDVRSLRR